MGAKVSYPQCLGEAVLTKKRGEIQTQEALAGKKLVALYFSAHWCPPCRGFTPALAQFYSRIKEIDPDAL
jgi:nucleoredoxin